jgi:CheY-like chemotaxis protein
MVARDAASPIAALGWVERGDPFDVAILDMQMPEMDGLALATAIRRLRGSRELPLILYTSLGRHEAGDGMDWAAQLTKPVKPSQLFDALAGVFGEGPAFARRRAGATETFDRQLATELPRHILLTEDNPTNQKVAIHILARLGYRADVAGNGLEALAALERQRYDLVLMDVQMPEMDGLEASRQICARWPVGERPYIVAMTADAMAGDRELCLAAGMDDYLTKPIHVPELVTSIRRSERAAPADEISPTLPVGGSETLLADASIGNGPDGSPVLDPAAIENLRGIVGGKREFLVELVDSFLTDAPPLLAEMRGGLADGDAGRLRRAAHTLKSNAAEFGANTLAGRCRDLEELARVEKLDAVYGLLAAAEVEFERVRTALGSVREEEGSR